MINAAEASARVPTAAFEPNRGSSIRIGAGHRTMAKRETRRARAAMRRAREAMINAVIARLAASAKATARARVAGPVEALA
jgi:hypothetical protein